MGLRVAVSRMEALAAEFGDRYLPPRLLHERAARGENFFVGGGPR
jgi:hypothetical protein